jgi:transposase
MMTYLFSRGISFIMTYGYSDDLRKAALACYARGGKTQQEVSVLFGVGLKTFARWRVLEKAGDFRLRPCPPRKRSHKIDGDALCAYVRQHPDSYLREIAAHFNVSDVGIIKALRRLGISRKKNQPVSRARRD